VNVLIGPKHGGRNSDYVRVPSQAVDAAIAKLAVKNYGNVTRRQLLGLGVDDDAIAYRVRIGRLHRVHRGIYAVGRRPVTPHEWASAAVLACGQGAALSHGSAMALWGFWRRWDRPFEVSVVRDRRTKMILVHRSKTLRWRDLTTHLGIRVTSPARTILDISPRLGDRALKRTVNNALNSDWLAESQLAELVTRHAHLPAARRIAPLMGLPGTPTRSGWEDEFPAFCERQGLPAPVMGARVQGYLVDALFEAEKVIVELDSWEFHKQRIAFETDRERDAETLAHGFVTIRMTWDRIEARPGREGQRLHVILAQRRTAQAPSAA
jgi:Transcriptional regulator, AbiEi antitoxin/Protein of unknown function (DUF559)